MGYRADPTQTVRVNVEGVAYGDHDVNAFNFEAYAWRPIPSSLWRSRVKLGAFYPEISLENRMQGWRSPYTCRFFGHQHLDRRGIPHHWRRVQSASGLGRSQGHDFDFTLSAAGYGWNDTAGTVMAFVVGAPRPAERAPRPLCRDGTPLSEYALLRRY